MPDAVPSRVNWKSGGKKILHLISILNTFYLHLCLFFPSLLARTDHAAVSCSNTVVRLIVPTCIPYYQAATIVVSFNAVDLSRDVPITITIFSASGFTSSSTHHNPNPLSLIAFYTLSETSSSYPLSVEVTTFCRYALLCFSWRLVDALARFLARLTWPLACDEQWAIDIAMETVPAVGSPG